MSRSTLADHLIDFLNKSVNCQNVMQLTDNFIKDIKYLKTDNYNTNLLVDNIPTACDIIVKDNMASIWPGRMYNIFDFMTESNFTGFEYFPYIYGVLVCKENEETEIPDTIYVYYESFEGKLKNLFSKIKHPSDWYDIAFQIIIFY